MAFEGYKFKFNLIAAHRFYDEKEELSLHTYTLELTLYIKRPEEIFIPYGDIEKIVNYILLSNYSEKVLNEIPPFDKIQPNIENMGQVFQQRIKAELASKGFILTSFEISETPLRTYIVNEACLEKSDNFYNRDHMTSYLLMKNIKAISNQQILSSISKHSRTAKPIIYTPVLEVELENQEQEMKGYKTEMVSDTERYTLPVSKKQMRYKLIISLLFLLVSAGVLTAYIKNTGLYPLGADIYGHLFKSDLLYDNIRQGNLYPLYTNLWYNGLQPFRYWAPLPYYILAGLQFISGGDAITSYLLFVFFAFFLGGCGWLLWGWQQNRILFCTFLAILWFFLPDNVRVFFSEGNLPRMTIAVMLPYLFYFVWQVIEYRNKKAISPIIIIMCMITLCHAMISAMTGISTFIFLLFYCIIEKRVLEPFYVIIAMLLSLLVCGIWLYPALHGGFLDMDAAAASEVMKSMSFPVAQSLNPLLRLFGHADLFYYGLSIFILSIVGVFLADKKSLPGFYTAIIVLLCTTTSIVPLLSKLPLNQFLWAFRFTPIVYALFILSLLEWKRCKRYWIIIMAIILIFDILPSADIQKYNSKVTAKVTNSIISAKTITQQRIALLDLSSYGSLPSYEICGVKPKIQYTFGWAWQGAENSPNIVRLNTAMEKGYFEYLFDRCLELGNDTVIVRKELVKKSKKNPSMLINAALDSGYNLYEETNYTYIFHKNTPSTFGVHTEYTGIAIGLSAESIALAYPCFEEGTYTNIEDYSFEELSKYKTIYLSGFFYRNRTAAEQLITKLAATGVKVIIDMNRIPIDPLTNRMTFLNVTAQTVTFTDRYPELMYKDEIYKGKRFKNEYSTWNTVYLENVKKSIGYSWFQNKNLDFIGTSENDNIVFIGFNILFHVMETDDKTILGLINDILGIKVGQLPVREVVPIKIQYGKDKIIIDAPRSDVNTTIAYQDNFKSEGKIIDFNNLLKVSNLHTEINIEYPYLIQGTIISVFGVLGTWKLFHFIFKRKGRLT